MASTVGITNAVNATGNLTNENVTARPIYYHSALISDKYQEAVVAIGSINAIFAIAVNLLLLVVIVTTQAMRKSLFHWNIINLCFWGLISGVITIPFTTSRFHRDEWIHGADFCQVFILVEYTQVAFPGMVFICLQIDRFVKVRTRENPTMHGCFKILQFTLLAFPWLFVLVICIPILIAGENDGLKFFKMLQENYCFHLMKDEYYMVMLYLMFVSPVLLLIVLNVISFIHLKFSASHWNRMAMLDNEKQTPDSTRLTVKVTMASTAIFVILWFPVVCLVLKMHVCAALKIRFCYTTELDYLATYTCGMTSSYLKQLPWFLLPDMRTSAIELVQCTSSAFVRKFNDVRTYFSKGPLIVEWPTKEQMEERDEEK